MIKKCIMCGKEYEVYDSETRGATGIRGPYKRQRNTVTCSKGCSRRYTFLFTKISSKLYKQITKLKKEIKQHKRAGDKFTLKNRVRYNRTRYHKYCDLGRLEERERILKIIKNFRDPKLSLKKCKRIRRLLKQEIKQHKNIRK